MLGIDRWSNLVKQIILRREDTSGSGPRSGEPVSPGPSQRVHFLGTENVFSNL